MPDNNTYQDITALTESILDGGQISGEQGLWLLQLHKDYLPWLMACADRIRKHYRGQEIEVCAISNVRSGNCSENCSFCSQSGHHKTDAPAYDYIDTQDLVSQARQARQWGASDFGVVSKGWGVRSQKEKKQLQEYFGAMSEHSDIGRCASIGVLDQETAQMLKDNGLENYHHNLESAESFFPQVCTTHSYQENIDTIRHAREAGLRVCAGGILGMGEKAEQRIELALTLRDLGVESVPLNFLNPQQGTPMGQVEPMAPLDILQHISVFRFLLPQAEIRVAGGRTFLGDMQSMIFLAGASGIMIGNYLTTAGRQVEDDLQMFTDLQLNVRGDTQERRQSNTGVD